LGRTMRVAEALILKVVSGLEKGETPAYFVSVADKRVSVGRAMRQNEWCLCSSWHRLKPVLPKNKNAS